MKVYTYLTLLGMAILGRVFSQPDSDQATWEEFQLEHFPQDISSSSKGPQLLVYGQAEAIFPSVGFALRDYRDSGIGIEGAGSVILFLGGVGGKGSVSFLKQFGLPWQKGEKNGYVGLGVGSLFTMQGEVIAYFPCFFGYQVRSFFGDIGTDFIFSHGVLPIPTLRLGVCF